MLRLLPVSWLERTEPQQIFAIQAISKHVLRRCFEIDFAVTLQPSEVVLGLGKGGSCPVVR